MSQNGNRWMQVPGTSTSDNDTFRNILDFEPISARYFRLLIKKWNGYAPQLNEIILYSPGTPPTPQAPQGDYVLIIGNQMNGFTFTELAQFIEELNLNLKTLTISHDQVSLEILGQLDPQPVAIVCSGNNAGQQNLPMFEYNGEFEIIRETDIPLLGICFGHQSLCLAYGYTFVRSMGYSDITANAFREWKKLDPITIRAAYRSLPIFRGMPSPFIGVEVHGWAVSPISLPEQYEITSESKYIQTLKDKSGLRYGAQFHPEIKVSYNQGTAYLLNFLTQSKIVADRNKKNKP